MGELWAFATGTSAFTRGPRTGGRQLGRNKRSLGQTSNQLPKGHVCQGLQGRKGSVNK